MNERLETQATSALSQPSQTSESAETVANKAPAHCANCNAQLAGHYCHECGQVAHVHRSIVHMMEELLHGILHFDSKAWRTLPALIIHPGKLTRDYIDGKRTRYVSPLFLFLFLNLVMFVALSYLGSGLGPDGSYKSLIKTSIANELQNTQTRLIELEAKRSSLPADDKSIAALVKEITQAREKQTALEKAIAATRAEEVSEKAMAEKYVPGINNQKGFWLEQVFSHALENPDLVLYKMKGIASKFAIILIPISLPFLWLLFIRRKDVVLFDHCIFSLYSLSFICLLIMLVATSVRLGWESWSWLLILIVPPVHMFAQLRGTYQLSIGSAFWRTLALLIIAGFALCVYFVAITWLSL